jgi:hypothetical protein
MGWFKHLADYFGLQGEVWQVPETLGIGNEAVNLTCIEFDVQRGQSG